MSELGVVALIAARNEADRIGDTVRAVATIPQVERIYVVENGSTDRTVDEARAAGAWVLTAPGGMGKGDALEGAMHRVRGRVYLLLDGDLGSSAKEAALLLEPVLGGRADLTVGTFPRDARHGGFGIVKRASRWLISALTNVEPQEPMSGQRALTARVADSVRPLAGGFGVEVAMTIDALRLGFRFQEVPVNMEHRYTGRDLSGFAHRGRQGWDILRAWAPRALRIR